MKRKKELIRIIISFRSKYQSPLIMVIKEYYATKQDKKDNNCYWAEVLFSTNNIRYYLKNIIKKIKIIMFIVMLLFLTGCENPDDKEKEYQRELEIMRWLENNMQVNNLFNFKQDLNNQNIINCYYKRTNVHFCEFYKDKIEMLIKNQEEVI